MENIWNNILGIVVSFIYVFGVIFLAKFLERFGKEASRKAVHILVCNWWLLAMVFFDSPLWAAVVPACFVILNYLSYRFQIFSSMERGAGKGDLGTVYYAISLLLLALITFGPLNNPVVGGVGILIMGYGDGLAAVVGTRWPKWPYQIFGSEKTLSGSLTMLGASFLVTTLLLAATGQSQVLIPAIALAVLATLLEAATPLGLDNLTVPLVSAGAYYYLFV
ncbi:SEC59/DGK1/VTE5 family protein [Acetobacterium wieringae]|uniref:diacylglycerol/polyprenol kinase family protein n=1 Tax=Acetobacterium wieringae TaxID=52694 RepID=UPI002B21DFD8|nr:SEC59/DGK1/VTE5 family protein [Acetobacterium wieringae]MEA4807073.1 SEC59/DGK1/VTE5 family protein [Acetobacterium wieringae]